MCTKMDKGPSSHRQGFSFTTLLIGLSRVNRVKKTWLIGFQNVGFLISKDKESKAKENFRRLVMYFGREVKNFAKHTKVYLII